MYQYLIRVFENGESFIDSIWADNSRDAIEIGEDKYPTAIVVLV